MKTLAAALTGGLAAAMPFEQIGESVKTLGRY